MSAQPVAPTLCRVLAATFHDVRDVRAAQVRDPRILDPRDVLVRVRASAICGSDLHPYRGHERGLDRGTVLGHEFVGEVIETGSAVTVFAPGSRVTGPFTSCCGACFYCARGLHCRCTQGQLFGWVAGGHGLHGAQAETLRVPLADSTLVGVPTEVDDERALLAGDVLSTGTFAVEQLGCASGDAIAVVGAGPVGLCAVWAARRAGHKAVFAFDFDPVRLELATRFGAVAIDAGDAAQRAQVLDQTQGRGLDGVVEAVGSASATRLAFELVRAGGAIAAVGVHTEPALAFSPGEAYDRNLSYRAGRCPARRFVPRLLESLRREGHELAALFSHRLPLAACAEAYALFDQRRDRCTKVLLLPSGPV